MRVSAAEYRGGGSHLSVTGCGGKSSLSVIECQF